VKKELYLPLVLIGLSAAFIAVSFLVWITRSNDSLLKKKLRIGAMILMLTGATVGCDCSDVTCYIQAMPNMVYIDGTIYPGGEVTLDLNFSNIIAGIIESPTSSVYSFQILDDEEAVIDRGPIEAIDGEYDDDWHEAFELSVSEDIASGIYDLYFYMATEENLTTHEIKPFVQFSLGIIGRQ
jgi:hypothetical protein